MITTETIDGVVGFDAGGLPVVSLYAAVPENPGDRRTLRSRVHSLIHEIRLMAEHSSGGRDAMLSLRSDIERMDAAVGEERWPPGAIAMFSCSGRGFFETVELPRSVRDRVLVDATPWVRPMLAVLDESHRCCVAVVDKSSARFWELYQRELREITKIRDRTLRNPAGLTEDKTQHKADELAKRHFRKVAAELLELFRTERFDLLAMGGHHEEVPGFVSEFPRELRERFAGTFTIDPATATLSDIRAQADAIVAQYERTKERKLVADVIEKVAAGGRATLGLDNCLWAAAVAAVTLLLVQEGACDSCGWLACAGDRCALCDGEARPTPDVVDEMVQKVIDDGGSIEHVASDAGLGDHLAGATLRFPLPSRPGDTGARQH
jgi:peptide chain release factor subunit 1